MFNKGRFYPKSSVLVRKIYDRIPHPAGEIGDEALTVAALASSDDELIKII